MAASAFARHLAFGTVAAALCAALAAGYAGYRTLDQSLVSELRARAADVRHESSSAVSAYASRLAERARLFAATGATQPDSPAARDFFTGQDGVLGLSLLKASDAGTWAPVFRWSHPEAEDSSPLGPEGFAALDRTHPIDFERLADGAGQFVFGASPDQAPHFRLVLPHGERGPRGFEQAVVIDARPSGLESLLAGSGEDLSTLVVEASGRLVVSSAADTHAPGDDVSSLGILRWARQTGEPQGELDAERASFERVSFGPTHFWVITRADRSRVDAAVSTYLLLMALVTTVLAALAYGWARRLATTHVNAPVRSLRGLLEKALADRGAAAAQVDSSRDELDRLADTLETVFDELERSKPQAAAPRPVAKADAFVLYARVHELGADAAELLAAFQARSAQAIESRGGTAYASPDGSVLGCFGLQGASAADVIQTLESCALIRELAAEIVPSHALALAVHHGPVSVAGNTAVGAAAELAARIGSFTDQFGIDLLLTGDAASRLPPGIATERVTAGDDQTPELHELADQDEAEAAA